MKTVRYIDLAGVPSLGDRALLKPFDHPNTSVNLRWVHTSEVQEVRPTIRGPVVITRNTAYLPWHEGLEKLDEVLIVEKYHEQ